MCLAIFSTEKVEGRERGEEGVKRRSRGGQKGKRKRKEGETEEGEGERKSKEEQGNCSFVRRLLCLTVCMSVCSHVQGSAGVFRGHRSQIPRSWSYK